MGNKNLKVLLPARSFIIFYSYKMIHALTVNLILFIFSHLLTSMLNQYQRLAFCCVGGD